MGFVHATATVEEGAQLGTDVHIWQFSQVRSGARLGDECRIGAYVFIDQGVRIGRAVKVQNHVSIYAGVTLDDGVFVGPRVAFTNDRYPRAVHPDMRLRKAGEWTTTPTHVAAGASIGAGAVIVAGVRLGVWCLVAAGAVVTRDVPAHALVMGQPARPVAVVDALGHVVHRPYATGHFTASDGQSSFEIEQP